MPHPPIYHFFISHKKSEATSCARYLKLLLQRYDRNLKIFYDSDDLIDLNQLKKYIEDTSTIIILLTENYFNSFWCFFEFMIFTVLNKPLVCFIFSEDNTKFESINLENIYDGFNKYQQKYITDIIAGDISTVLSDMHIKIISLISDSEIIPTFTDVNTNINLFRDTALIKMDTIIKNAKFTGIESTGSDSTSAKSIGTESTGSDSTSVESTRTEHNICLSFLKDTRYCENTDLSKFILVGYKKWEVISTAKIIKYLCITDLEISPYLLFDTTNLNINFNKCNTVVIVLLYDECLIDAQFANNLLFIHEEAKKSDKTIIFQGLKVDTNFEYLEIDKIDEITEKLYSGDINKKSAIQSIYIMLIKQYISIPFDSYQSLDILKIQLLQIKKRLLHFLPESECQFYSKISHI